MIKKILLLFICKYKKHTLVYAGSCPVTGKVYVACLRCGATIAK
jgi:hypothetical protein